MDKYEIVEAVGEGAYGIVLKCRNKETAEVVAIKKFKESDDNAVVRKTTLREIRILKMLRHENIVSLHEAFRRKGRLYLVFEYVERNLLEVLEEFSNGLPCHTVKHYIYQLTKGIVYCHNHDVIHRDIKPENILISQTGLLKLCDFGFARTVTLGKGNSNGDAVPLTEYVATRWYRPPELLLGSKHYGRPVDIWSIACIMGELLDGQPLFPGQSEIDQLYLIQKVIGPLTSAQMELFLRNPRFVEFKFGDMSRPETLGRRYLGKCEREAISFMKALCQMDPDHRPTASGCLAHVYFDDIREDSALSSPNSASCSRVTTASHHQNNSDCRSIFGSSSNASSAGSPCPTPIPDTPVIPKKAKKNSREEGTKKGGPKRSLSLLQPGAIGNEVDEDSRRRASLGTENVERGTNEKSKGGNKTNGMQVIRENEFLPPCEVHQHRRQQQQQQFPSSYDTSRGRLIASRGCAGAKVAADGELDWDEATVPRTGAKERVPGSLHTTTIRIDNCVGTASVNGNEPVPVPRDRSVRASGPNASTFGRGSDANQQHQPVREPLHHFESGGTGRSPCSSGRKGFGGMASVVSRERGYQGKPVRRQGGLEVMGEEGFKCGVAVSESNDCPPPPAKRTLNAKPLMRSLPILPTEKLGDRASTTHAFVTLHGKESHMANRRVAKRSRGLLLSRN